MNDSEFFEQVVKILADNVETFKIIGGALVLIFFTLLFLTLIMFFKYYDKELDRKKKDTDDNIRRIIKQEKEKE